MDIILYLILSSIPCEPHGENISSDDVPTLRKEDKKVEALSWKVREKVSITHLSYDNGLCMIRHLTQILHHNTVNLI